MTVNNNTCVPGNDTSACPAPGSAVGQAVGLTLFFLLLAIVVGLVVYKYHSVIWSMLPFRHTRSQMKEDYREAAETESHPYTSMKREQPVEQAPIYENLKTRTAGHNRPSVDQRRLSSEPEEDVYLQCDLPDDAIYSNDPACSLSILPDSQEEDVYIMPDSC